MNYNDICYYNIGKNDKCIKYKINNIKDLSILIKYYKNIKNNLLDIVVTYNYEYFSILDLKEVKDNIESLILSDYDSVLNNEDNNEIKYIIPKTIKFNNLVYLDLYYCCVDTYYNLPDFNQIPNLKKLDISGIKIKSIEKLKEYVNLEELICSDMKLDKYYKYIINEFPNLSKLKNLKNLTLSYSNFNNINIYNIVNIVNLEYLNLSNCTNYNLPNISKLKNLKILHIMNNEKMILPDLSNTKIEILNLRNSKIKKIINLQNYIHLKQLILNNTFIFELPYNIGNLINLEILTSYKHIINPLSIVNCRKLKPYLPDYINNIYLPYLINSKIKYYFRLSQYKYF